MPNDNICYSLATDGVPDLEDLWAEAKRKYGTIPNGEKPENNNKQTGENKVKKNRLKTTYIIVAVYIILIMFESIFCVPYHRIQIFRSNQNVPHTEIVGSGYATIYEIESSRGYMSNSDTSSIGKIVNTPQLFMNVSITTFLAVAMYFILQNNEKVKEGERKNE